MKKIPPPFFIWTPYLSEIRKYEDHPVYLGPPPIYLAPESMPSLVYNPRLCGFSSVELLFPDVINIPSCLIYVAVTGFLSKSYRLVDSAKMIGRKKLSFFYKILFFPTDRPCFFLILPVKLLIDLVSPYIIYLKDSVKAELIHVV